MFDIEEAIEDDGEYDIPEQGMVSFHIYDESATMALAIQTMIKSEIEGQRPQCKRRVGGGSISVEVS